MAQGVISDNWSLQEVSELFTVGLDGASSNEIVLKNSKHSYNPIMKAIVQTEALFDFLTDLILRDEILVDEKFVSAWEQYDSPIIKAKKLGVLRTFPFLDQPEKISEPREKIVEHICSVQSLRDAHKLNVEGWNATRCAPDPMLSATLWGGAGMCARGFVYEKGYTPHPLRRRLFINSGFMLSSEDSLHQVQTFIEDKKVRVTKKIYGTDSLLSTYINLPAIPIRIIQDSNSPAQMISTALDMRNDFQSLRDWLKMFQNTIGLDDTKNLLKFRKQLDSVSQYIDKKIGYGVANKPVSMEAGMGIFKIAIQGNPIESIKNQFGVRATLNKLILSGTGKAEIKKFVKMFGENGTKIGYEIEKHFTHGMRQK